jgi:hypothetical protein
MIAGHLHNARCMWIKTLGQAAAGDLIRGFAPRNASCC